MWNSKYESEQESSEDDYSSRSSSPSIDAVARYIDRHVIQGAASSGYVDQHGNPNPLYLNTNTDNERGHSTTISRQRSRNQHRLNLFIDFLSDLSFFFGAFMYLWLALSEGRDLFVETDINRTANGDDVDDGEIKLSASADRQTGWFLENDRVFNNVTLYMVYGFIAGLLMFAAGALRLFNSRTPSDRVPYGFMVFASALAMVSSAMMGINTFASDACFSVAIHWYALQAATLLLWKFTRLATLKRSPLRFTGDALYLTASLCGIILSYIHLFGANNALGYSHDYLAIGAACVWWLATVVYLVQSLLVMIRQETIDEENNESHSGDTDVESPEKTIRQEETGSISENELESSTGEDNYSIQREDSEDTYNDSEDTDIIRRVESDDKSNYFFRSTEEKSVFTAKSSLDDIFEAGEYEDC